MTKNVKSLCAVFAAAAVLAPSVAGAQPLSPDERAELHQERFEERQERRDEHQANREERREERQENREERRDERQENRAERAEERAERRQERYERHTARVEERVGNVIERLEEAGIDTASSAAALSEFQSLSGELADAFAALDSALETYQGDTSQDNKAAVNDARSTVNEARNALRVYYAQTLRPTLKEAIDEARSSDDA